MGNLENIGANIFSQYMQRPNIFSDKRYLTSAFVPGKISHRDIEIEQISGVLAPVLKGYNPNNIFIYGTCGTGKTICAKFVVNQLRDISSKNNRKIRAIYINCKMKKVADTEYRLLAQLLKELGECVPDTGLPTNVLYRRFFERIESLKSTVILILDEIDALVKKVGDDFLYNFTRVTQELKTAHIAIVGITNDLSLRDNLDLRVKSSLSEEEVIFKPYNANQLRDILVERARQGFVRGAVEESVISKCAALAAQEHGDARRALDLLRVAGEIAERLGETRVIEKHADMAEQKVDLDRITETIKCQPTQSQIVLYAILKLGEKRVTQKGWTDKRLLTGDVFAAYINICSNNGIKPLTQRRISDLIGELDMLGIITAKVVSNGRYGRTREIVPAINGQVLERVMSFLTSKFN